MHTLLEICLSNAIMATLLALLAAGVTRLACRPALSHVLWLLVLLKLVTPPLVVLPLSLPASWTASARPQTIAPEAYVLAGPVVEDDADVEEVVAGPEAVREAFTATQVGESKALESPTEEGIAQANAGLADQPGLLHGALYACLFFWLAGSCVWFLVAGFRIRGFHQLLRYGRPAPPEVQEQATQLAQRLGLEHCPRVWLVPGRISPLLWAFGRRVRLVVPSDLLKRLAPEQQATLLAHELAHARRYDHWVRWFEVLVTGLYWWHPVTWWARREIHHAEEQCCDAWVVWMLPSAAKAYAKALLQTVVFLDARPALPPVASGIGHVHHLKRRLSMIVREPHCPRLAWPLLLGVVLVGSVVLPLAPQHVQATYSTDYAIFANDEFSEPQQKAESGQSQDLERRLQRLEERLDRVIRSLEQSRGRLEQGKTPEAVSEAKKAKETTKETTKSEPREIRRRIEVEVKNKATEQTQEAEKKIVKPEVRTQQRRIEIIDGKSLDPERLKELEKRIHEAVNQAVNPERMKQLERQIQDTVSKTMDPQRMKELEQRIHETIHRTLSPERMEALSRQIEAAVSRSLAQQDRDRAKAAEKSEKGEKAEKAPTASAQAKVQARVIRTPQPTPSGERRDLERRIERLEQRMDKLLQSLESSGKPAK